MKKSLTAQNLKFGHYIILVFRVLLLLFKVSSSYYCLKILSTKIYYRYLRHYNTSLLISYNLSIKRKSSMDESEN